MESSHIPYDQLIAYAAGELDAAASSAVTAHTTGCSECTRTVVWFKRVRGLVRADPTREPPSAVVARAQAIFSEKNTAPQPRLPRLSFPPLFQVARRFSAAAVLAGVMVVLVLFFGGVGTAAAATRGSLPGDTLYPVKIAVESVQLAVTPDPVDKAELHLSLAETRIREMQALNANGANDNIPATARSYADQVNQAEKLLTSAKQENRPVAAAIKQMDLVVARSDAILTTLLAAVPAEDQPAIAAAIAASPAHPSTGPDLQAQPKPSPPVRGKPTVTSIPSATALPPQAQNTTSSNEKQCADSTPPSLTVDVSPSLLWPANHKYVTVTVAVNVTDKADPNPQVAFVSVTSNEPDSSLGDGDLPNDIVIVNNFTFQLRAERSGTGPGRVYTITYSAVDACNNNTRASVTVAVPHDQAAPDGYKPPQGQPDDQQPQGQPSVQPPRGQTKTPPGQNKSP